MVNIETLEKAREIGVKINKCDEEIENLGKLIADPSYRRIKIGRYGRSGDHMVKCPSANSHNDFVKQILVELRDMWEETRLGLMEELEKL